MLSETLDLHGSITFTYVLLKNFKLVLICRANLCIEQKVRVACNFFFFFCAAKSRAVTTLTAISYPLF